MKRHDYTRSFGFQWNAHARTQLDSHTGLPISRERLFGVSGWPQSMPGETILEAGSGAGRFTEVLLATGAEVFSFDFSEAVNANAANNGRHPNLHLFRGDIFRIPFRAQGFARVMCLGVLQHTPDPKAAFMSLAAQVRPGGELVIDVYAKRLSSLLHWKYALRPLTTRMNKQTLYRVVRAAVPLLLPLAVFLRRIGGRAAARLVPVVEYSTLGLSPELHREWSTLDTFDALAPRYDLPQTVAAVQSWYREAGFTQVRVFRGPNGVVGRGTRPV
jgi:SAM-dependent methyltransferase